ncbi:MAG: orotate phosphoribosyltransferase [Thermodesulfobacteriota bacterium]
MDVDQQIMLEDYKKDLLEILYARSFQLDPDKGFTLASGAKSDVYIDVKKTALSAEAMELVGYAFFVKLKLEPVDCVGGLTLGADPLAYAAALVSTMHGKYLDAFVVRKEPKAHGTQKWIEGNVREDAWAVIIEDVVTTGESTIKAIERAREAGMQVRKVIAFVDREEGGKERIEKEGHVKFDWIFTKSDLLEVHEKHEEEKKKEEAEEEMF